MDGRTPGKPCATYLLLSGALVLFLSTVIALIVALDQPLRGDVSVGPDAYVAVYERMKGS